MTLQTLYKSTKTGKVQQYNVQAVDDKIVVTQGQVDGKKQEYVTTCTSKNQGKTNETTPAEQAILEAASKHAKKLKAGYTTDPSGELTVMLPMKVKPYVGNESKINFPALSTAKLDGVNGTYWLRDDDTLVLTSRGGDYYPAIPHMEDEIRKIMELFNTNCLCGELYIHGVPLQDITSAVKKPKKLSERLTFRIFDAPFVGKTYQERRKVLDTYYLLGIFVETILAFTVLDVAQLEQHYADSIQRGYEGTVIYNTDAPYQFNVRSSYVYKYKKAQDAEFIVSHYNIDKNGHPVFTCIANEKPFKVKPKGTAEQRLQIIEDFYTHYKGNFYKVEYETLSKDGIPLKPVGIGLRKCDNDGNPLE